MGTVISTRSVLLILLMAALAASPVLSQDEDATVPSWREKFARKYETPRDYGYDWKLGWMFALTPEDGVLPGLGAILYRHGFRQFPYTYRMELTGGASIPTGRMKLVYVLSMPSLGKRFSFDLRSHFSEVELRNFYGYGNDTRTDKDRERRDFYRVASQELALHTLLSYAIHNSLHLGLGTHAKHLKVTHREERFLTSDDLGPYGNDRLFIGLGGGVHLDTRDHHLAPHRGVWARASGWNYADPLDDGKPFQRVTAEVRVYIGDTLFTDVMAAVRLKGEKIYGEPPLHEAAFLGGSGSLRGFPMQRFAGDASLLACAEVRIALARPKLIVPTEVGLLFLADAGRVWVSNASPGGVHADAGVGLWLAPLSRDVILSLSAARSTEGLFVTGGVGFGF